jgi:hypothetical protein
VATAVRRIHSITSSVIRDIAGNDLQAFISNSPDQRKSFVR